MYTPKSIAVLGPGAVGGFLASVFWKNGVEVTCIGLESEVNEINNNGINVKSSIFGDFVAKPKAYTDLTNSPDILFITVKANYLEQALEKVKPELLESTVIIPLLNGLEHVSVLRERYGNRIVVGSISIEVFKSKKGETTHKSPFSKIRIASDNDVSPSKVADIVQWFSSIGIEAQQGPSEADVIWKKLVRLQALALSTAATNRSIGELRQNPEWRNKILACVREASTVAQSLGANINPNDVIEQIDTLGPEQLSSLQRDVSQGKTSELDAIAGAIVRAGEKNKIKCSNIKGLIHTINSSVNKHPSS